MNLAKMIFESFIPVLIGIVLVEIALFVLAFYRDRYIAAPVTAGILGGVYSALAANYFNYLEDNSLFGHLGEFAVCYYAIYGFAILTAVLGFAFAVVHSKRKG